MRMMPSRKERLAPDEGVNRDHSATRPPKSRVGRCSLQLHLVCGNVRPRTGGAGPFARLPPRQRGDPFARGEPLQPKNDGREIVSMKKMLALSLALAAAVSVSACQTPQQQNALAGGALGGGAGALVGSAVTHGSAGGALAGAAIGAGSGAMIGAASTPPPRPTPAAYGAPPRPMRALGLRLQRQPHLRGVLLSAQCRGRALPVSTSVMAGLVPAIHAIPRSRGPSSFVRPAAVQVLSASEGRA